MLERVRYLELLKGFKDKDLIKAVTGVRGCGKSTLFDLFIDYLKKMGVKDEQIIKINLEDPDYNFVNYKDFYDFVNGKITKDKKYYVFLDEVQTVPLFQKAVDGLYIKKNVDVYITGSNAYLLSGELATLLSGRYVEISMLPLSFCEYLTLTELPKEEAFTEFMKTGGIPYIAVMNRTDEKVDQYLEGIYNTVIVKDIEERQIRIEKDAGKRKITDIALLKTIARYLASVVGSPVSMKSVTDYLISSGRKISANTVGDYVEALTESFVFYPAERFDIVGKQLLKANRKMYIVDLGLRNHILPRKRYDLGFSVENIVFFELLRRGNKVNIGKIGAMEVDFVAQKQGVLTYYQVTADMTAEETFEREMRPLRGIQDNYDKIVLTLDRFSIGNYDGIKVINVIDWLLEK